MTQSFQTNLSNIALKNLQYLRIAVTKTTPTDSGYLSKVILPEGLLTNYNKRLIFTHGMQGQAEIITEKMRLSDRLFNGLRKLINH